MPDSTRPLQNSNRPTHVRIGTAGWSIPRAAAPRFETPGTHLQRYAATFTCAEINSSFHRPHTAATYAKWRDSTPAGFRFAVKIPRAVTHDLKLRAAREPFEAFLRQTDGLAEKRGPLLLQLPPSLAFDGGVVADFLDEVRQIYDGPLVCEPRHATWFEAPVAALLERYRIARVAADPPPVPAANSPGAWPGIAYFRLHGSPRTYWSRYDDDAITALASTIGSMAAGTAQGAGTTTVTAGMRSPEEAWCIFDNTASGAAIENAWELRDRLAAG